MSTRALFVLLVGIVPVEAAFGQDCFAPVTAAQLDEALVRADAAWSAGDMERFRAESQEAAVFLLPCLDAPITGEVAAHLHRVRGLEAFLDRQRELADGAMAASRALAPGWTPAETLLPPGHELRVALEAPPRPAVTERLPAPKGASLYFDGAEGRLRPTDRPTVAQVETNGGLTSAWLAPGAAMLPYPTAAPRTRTALAISAGVAAAAFGGLYGGSFATRAAYFNTDPADGDRLDRLRSTTAGLGGSGIALGVSAVGLAIAAIAVGPR